MANDTAARLRAIADGIDDVADSVNTSLLDRYIDEIRTIAAEMTASS